MAERATVLFRHRGDITPSYRGVALTGVCTGRVSVRRRGNGAPPTAGATARRAVTLVAAAALSIGTAVAVAPAASAAPTCPTVAGADQGGTVSPAPTAGVDWSGCSLGGANLAGANLSGANLTNAILDGANLTNANLTDANLLSADLDNVVLTGATITGSTLSVSSMQHVRSGGLVGTPASGADGFDLIGGYLIGATADLQGANLSGLSVSGRDFSRASLIGADLTNAAMQFANLTGADLRGATVSGTSFDQALMTGARGCNLTGTPSELPLRWTVRGGCLFGPTATIAEANLAGADLSGVDLTNGFLTTSNLDGANLTGATLTGVHSTGNTGEPASLPTGWQLVNGFLIGPGANLSGNDLWFLDLPNAHLAGADLSSTHLNSTNLTGADLTGANLDNADLTGTNLTGATIDDISYNGTVWTHATCPDGSSADSHTGVTCLVSGGVTAPAASITAPRTTFQSTTSFLVSWRVPANAGKVTYDVRYTSSSAFGGRTSAPVVWKHGVAGTRATFAGARAHRYCFWVRAHGQGGVVGAWSAPRCTTVATDDRALSASSGWKRGLGAGWLAGTYTSTTGRGQLLVFGTPYVHQLGVVATTCPTCGSLTLYVGRTKVGTISLVSPTTVLRKALTVKRLKTRVHGAIRIVVTSSKSRVTIDGLLTTAW
jgi:uncharacterized protein YjbI with pentapeptide repeats